MLQPLSPLQRRRSIVTATAAAAPAQGVRWTHGEAMVSVTTPTTIVGATGMGVIAVAMMLRRCTVPIASVLTRSIHDGHYVARHSN